MQNTASVRQFPAEHSFWRRVTLTPAGTPVSGHWYVP